MNEHRRIVSQASQAEASASAKKDQDEDLKPVDSAAKEEVDQLDQAMGAVLDDIQSVLEENAEEYVNRFVQKGGQ
ncbi:ubiquitin-like protein Pup [Parascardovia denticolens DSM 10105 = JCM 12538]|uniref:Prokaryotic ubiquitin-like protein Pup n=1 Tax=Parascardovia denticolens DSM 10105 = JCM 12538 TaxID=864564 RepID=E6K0V3_PARDN|nr:ubiquitin-like protein Pup [Parascardovia denticolens]EFG33051.1 ubiquitin-like protein Pup [Parascardovia denticolens F0305]EFT83434.1 ubiquitin-like protein Pup [Parascardovia denticolens DSM 10105 = JCM 12538]BAR05678.1 conserved hypothetical protein [Parascardovia denticolens DSM 10105 = JCM 12538]